AILAEREPLLRDTALVLEAQAAEAEIARRFPGLVPALVRLRRRALATRPPVASLSPARQPLEHLVRAILEADPGAPPGSRQDAQHDPLTHARDLLDTWAIAPEDAR